jgi:hypothetical protein
MYESIDMMIKLFVGMELNFDSFEEFMFKNFIDLCLFLIKEPSNMLNKLFQYEILILIKKSFIEVDPAQSFNSLLLLEETGNLSKTKLTQRSQ